MSSAEFQRNLWLELSPGRLIAAPTIIGIFVALSFAFGDDSIATGVALFEGATWACYPILYFWGGWMAAGAVLGEINEQTWQVQRMSALGAWSMTWGKLFGATIFVWYGTAILFAVALLGQALGGDRAFDDQADGLIWMLEIALAGLLVQAAAFASGLLMAGKVRARQRGSITLAISMGLLAGAIASLLTSKLPEVTSILETETIESLYWYDGRYGVGLVGMASLILFAGFAVFAGYRLMRRELQFRSWPWGLPLFALVLTVYVAGYPAARLTPDQSFAGLFSLIAFGITVFFTYLSAFLDRNDPIRYRSLLTALDKRRWREVLGLLPWWMPQFALAILSGVAVLLFASQNMIDGVERLMPGEIRQLIFERLWVPALLALLLRDVAFLLWLNMSGRHRRPDVGALIFLLLFYFPVQGLLHGLGMGEVAGLFFITPGANPMVTLFGGLVAAVIFLGLAVKGAKGRLAPVGRGAIRDGDTPWSS